MAYWQQLDGILDPIPIREFRGVFKPEDEGFNLPDDLFTDLVNFCPDAYPALTTRPGYTVAGTFGSGSILGLGAWKNSELHAVFSDGSWRRLNGDGTWTSLKTGLSTTAEWSFCNFQGNLSGINLIGANGVDPVQRYDGTTVQALSNAPAGANYIDTQGNRLYCATGNTINFSALNKPTDWTTVNDAGTIVHNTSDGETINGLKAQNGKVTVFKPSSTYELYGKGPTSYSLDRIAADIGATGNKAVTVFDNVLHFTSRDGLYDYAGGILPEQRFSEPVKNFVIGSNKAYRSVSVSSADDRYAYFGIPYGVATQVNTVLQYDVARGNWYTWEGIAVTQMVYISGKLYFGDASGRVLLIGGTTDNGNAITSTAVTKPFTTASIARKQHWFRLWVVASVPTGSTLSVYVSATASGDTWTLTKTLTASSDMQYKEILIPTGSIAAANAVRIKLVGTGPVTIHEITRQIRQLPMRR